MLASWHAAKEQQFWWFIAAWLSPTFGIGEMIYVFYMTHIFTSGRCPRCLGLARLVVYKVGPGARVEAIPDPEAFEVCRENNLEIPPP